MKKITDSQGLTKTNEFYDTNFIDINFPDRELKNIIFENCGFISCNFSETKFHGCKFIDCELRASNLSNSQFDESSFSEVMFYDSKAIGINWTKLRWPYIKLSSPFQFYKTDISHSSFYSLELKELVIEECKAHDVDFRSADLSGSFFMATDFKNSQFMLTKLYAADLTDAINYFINPNKNDVLKAKFSMPDVINLLHSFDIEIQD